MIPRPLAFFVASAALTLAAGAAGAACQFQKLAEVPVTMDGLRPTIMAKINGQDAKFLVDTGAFFGGVTEETAARYKMKHAVAPFGLQVQTLGGVTHDIRAVAADTFSFSTIGVHDLEFMVGGRLGGEGIAGNIGQNLLGPFDVEYDLGNGMMRYFKATGCGDANLAYWSAGVAVSRLPLVDPTNIITAVVTYAKVDGRQVRVTWDSGASLSVLSRPAAARAGINVTSEGVTSAGISYGVYGKGLESFLAPFASFQVGQEEIKNTQLRVTDIGVGNSDMLLGADFFLSHRILVSNSQKKVYFSYSGGPVFRLGAAPRPQAEITSPTRAAAGGPKAGAEFAGRAAAQAARRDYLAAIADYTRAIELEPKAAGYYRARAAARLAVGQSLTAMADIDSALKLDPGNTDALMLRGEVALAMHEPAKAGADFDQVMKLAPGDSGLTTSIGLAYARAGLYEPAIRALDVWIAADPRDEDLPLVLNARCYARGVWGKQLDLALADCDAALKRDKNSAFMDSRGLVLLRMGRLDEAIIQYAAAIKAQPRAAMPLYGRGLAQLKKGQRSQGEADIAAAKALEPGVEQEFKRMGLASGDAAAAKS